MWFTTTNADFFLEKLKIHVHWITKDYYWDFLGRRNASLTKNSGCGGNLGERDASWQTKPKLFAFWPFPRDDGRVIGSLIPTSYPLIFFLKLVPFSQLKFGY